MRRRGVIFKSFKDINGKDNPVVALSKLNENLKLVLEVLADLRVNTSDDPKEAARRDGDRGNRRDRNRGNNNHGKSSEVSQ